MLFRAMVDAGLILFGFYLFAFLLVLTGYNIFLDSIFSDLGILFSYLLILAETLWNRV